MSDTLAIAVAAAGLIVAAAIVFYAVQVRRLTRAINAFAAEQATINRMLADVDKVRKQ